MNAEQLFNACSPEPMSGCWLWTKGIKDENHQYGVVWHNGKKMKAHRLSYELHIGEIPEGMHVLHKCDNPICCNPDHLFIGTHADNMKDMSNKDRCNALKGEDGNAAKLTHNQVVEIKKQLEIHGKKYGTLTRLGNEYGVSHKAIQYIRDGRNWAHV